MALVIASLPNATAATRGACAAMRLMLKQSCGMHCATRRFSRFKFRRQVPFQNFILGFVCFEHRLVIEIDGSQHTDNIRDSKRDEVLAREGFQVIRYWNNDVLRRRNAVLEDLFSRLGLGQPDPSPGALRAPPSPTRGEGTRLVASVLP